MRTPIKSDGVPCTWRKFLTESRFDNCKMGVPALKFSKHIDLNTYFKGTTPGMLSFELENNLSNKGVVELPGLLKHPIIEGSRVIAEISPAQTAKALEAAQREVKRAGRVAVRLGPDFRRAQSTRRAGQVRRDWL